MIQLDRTHELSAHDVAQVRLHRVAKPKVFTVRVTLALAAWVMLWGHGGATAAPTDLSDRPLFSDRTVPGNLALVLSVEFPTAISVANLGPYDASKPFLGYFDPKKCYGYQYSSVESARHFYPAGLASNQACTSTTAAPRWSGSFLNWATMQTIDPFRKVLTGGYRVTDTPSLTILEKSYGTQQGSFDNFPNRSIPGSGTDSALVAGATPFNVDQLTLRVWAMGNKMRFTRTGDVNDGSAVVPYDPGQAPTDFSKVYEISIRVKVCDPSPGAGGVESNCVAYGSNYKPEGLIQQYAKRIRFSAFGYLNDSDIHRDGGVLRARQKFVGPVQPRPGLTDVANTRSEWDPSTGVFVANPDAPDASDTATLFGVPVGQSGVINYLNKFGQLSPGSYKTYDPVSELYYAAVRYFKNQGNVSEWTSMSTANASQRATYVDGFPVVTNWDDPIQYACQKNYILGIGDVNTHADKNLPGSMSSATEPTKPSAVSADATVNVVTATNKVGALEGLGSSLGTSYNYNGCCSNNAAYIAGLAYDSHTKDIRPDNPAVPQSQGMQTISTYWLDVLEYSTFKPNNQYFLATKYGGFRVPNGYDPYAATAGPADSTWTTNGEVLFGSSNKRPDNYYYASRADQMIAGLTAAFASIASDMKANSTGLALPAPQITAAGSASYSAMYDASNWSGEVTASQLTFDPVTQTSTVTQAWKASTALAAQFALTGWDTNRRVVTWNGLRGVPFRSTGTSAITSAQLAQLDTAYGSGVDGASYLNYLRGDRSNEEGSAISGAKGYRARTALLGDISGSKVTVTAAPNYPYSDAANPGYAAFKAAHASRPPIVYVGANDGMLHAFNGALSGPGAGQELFAYVPSALFSGPTSPQVDGLAALGNPNFVHHNYVDATAKVYDLDFAKTAGASGGPAVNWRSVLMGGLGKGGKSYYAIDVTNPSAMTSEAAVASRVLWEFPNASTPAADVAKLGFSFGPPIVTKTAKWGWVAIFTSGYNNADGRGYFFFVNPRTGELLETVTTGIGDLQNPSGMAYAAAYVQDFTNNLAESIYAGDLLGNVWRLDVRASSGTYPTPIKLAQLASASNQVQSVTTAPTVTVHPQTGVRYVLVGTGRLLADSDIASATPQTFYAIVDGNGTAFNTAAVVTALGGDLPITRSQMVPNTDTLSGITSDNARPMGWYLELGTASSGAARRMVIGANAFNGVVAFASTGPSGDACSPSGTSTVYVVDIATGLTQLVRTFNGVKTAVNYVVSSNMVIDLKLTSVPSANGGFPATTVIAGYNTGDPQSIEVKSTSVNQVRRINWRELKLAR